MEENHTNGSGSASTSDSKSTRAYDADTAIIKTQIQAWLEDNTYASFGIVDVEPYPGNCITFEIKPKYLTNAKKHQFQVFCNDKWRPSFLTSESSVLEEQISLLNAQLEMQSQTKVPMTVTNLLGMLAMGYNEKYQPSSQTPSTSISTLSTGYQFNHNDSDMELESLPLTSNARTAYDIAFEKEFPQYVTPTEEHWEKVILPEVERLLYRENFQPFEVDEWFRRIQVQLNRGDTDRALEIIQHDILGGALPPSHLRKFFPPRNSRLIKSTAQDKTYTSVGATPECVTRLQAEISQLKEMNTKDLGFIAGPCGTDLLHWTVKLTGFGTDSVFGQELMEWHLGQNSMSDQTNFDAEVTVEIKFPPNFPVSGPSFRIIRPRLIGVEADLTASTADANAIPLTASALLDKQKTSWDSNKTIVDIILGIRSLLLESGIHVDVKSGDEGYALPTVGNFWRTFTCMSPSTANKPELENGGKIIMPASVLEEVSQFDMETPMHHIYNPGGMWSNYGKSLRSSTQSTPMVFELSTELSSKRSFCGVEEFTAPEGSIVVPKWMMENLGAFEGVPISVRRVKLPRGSYVKLQPHTSEFLKVNDTKAMLEWVLPKFVVLSVGDTIVVPYRDKKFSFNVLEVKPGRAIHIIDSDITTDFAPPLDGENNPYQLDNAADNNANNTNTTSTKDESAATPEKDAKAPTVGRMDTTNQTEGVDFKICDNCKQHIPIQSYNMHTLSCARMNWFCPACNVVVQKAQKEQHMKDAHTIVHCECGAPIETRLLASHKSNDCPRRLVPCAYCPLQMPYVERFEHEQRCGAQTEKCDICSKYVAKKDMPVHIVECMQPKRKPSPTYRQYDSYEEDDQRFSPYGQNFHPTYNPMLSSPSRSTQRVTSSEDSTLWPCPICNQNFQQYDDLQVHVLTAHETFEATTTTNTPQNTVQD